MNRLFARLATVVAAVPLLVGTVSGSANAGDTTIPGCYGVGVVVCNLTITIGAPIGVGTYETTIPVCAGSCSNVPVTLVGTTPGEPARVCYRYSDYYGSVTSYCVGEGGGGGGGLLDEVQAILDGLSLDEVVYTVEQGVYRLQQRVEDLIGGNDVCLLVTWVLYEAGIDGVYCVN